MGICFIGFGEVGRIYAEALAASGEPITHVSDAFPTDAGRALADKLGARIKPEIGDWLADCDVVISAVTGAVALQVAEACLAFMRPGSLLVDMTTAAPDAMQSAAELARRAGVRFADVGILGAVSIRKGATALAVAGDGAEPFRQIAEKLGAPLKVLPGAAGDAVRLKLLRSVFTKGMEALAVETLVAAERQGLRSDFHDIMADVDQTPLKGFLEVLVRTHVLHAGRRQHEVEDAERQLARIGLTPLVTPAVGDLFSRTALAEWPADARDEIPTMETALAWLARVATAEQPAAEVSG